MTPLSELMQQGAAHAWLFVPSAILLGALHGLEPGHSKTMMAAFIVAVRGTVAQAVLLGLSAALSHTAVVWAVALVGLHYASQFDAETSEPYFSWPRGLLSPPSPPGCCGASGASSAPTTALGMATAIIMATTMRMRSGASTPATG